MRMSPKNDDAMPWRLRLALFGLVLALHGGVLALLLHMTWPMRTQQRVISVALHPALPMSASIVNAPVVHQRPEPSSSRPTVKPSSLSAQFSIPALQAPSSPTPETTRSSLPLQVAPVVSAPTEPIASVATAGGESEPDYRAAYLQNPHPAYPSVARRMGWEGRVVLNVEVLSAGNCGQISVLHSSGHEVLDQAALETVKNWHFTPARRAGQAITQWCKVPISFSLAS